MKQLAFSFKPVCSICNSEKVKVIAHHLSYDPEIIIFLCRWHHAILHGYAKISPEKKLLMNEWAERYGHLWVRGAHKKSLRRKQKTKLYKKIAYRKHREVLIKKRTQWGRENREKEHAVTKRYYTKQMNDPILHRKYLDRKNREQQKRRAQRR